MRLTSSPSQPRFVAPDRNAVAELGFGDLAPPSQAHWMQDWKWYIDCLTRFRPEWMQRRAECAQQPTDLDCIYADAERGIKRARPAIRTPDPNRAPNDYDSLADLTVRSPNGKAVGFWDWSREEIERENLFTPPPPRTPELFTPSPVPAEGTLEQMMWSSMGGQAAAEASRRRRSPSEIPPHLRPAPSALSQQEVAEFVPRFRSLPYEYRRRVWAANHFRGVGWMEAVKRAEEQLKLSHLVPTQRGVYRQVKGLQRRAKRLLAAAEKDSRDRTDEFRISVSRFSGFLPAVDHAFSILHAVGDEAMLIGAAEDGEPQFVTGTYFWYAAVEIIDSQGLDRRGIDLELRIQAVQKIHSVKRLNTIRYIVEDIAAWFGCVGDRGKELKGIYQRGDFWSKVLEEWEGLLDQVETEYCRVEDREALGMSMEELTRLLDRVSPVAVRAG